MPPQGCGIDQTLENAAKKGGARNRAPLRGPAVGLDNFDFDAGLLPAEQRVGKVGLRGRRSALDQHRSGEATGQEEIGGWKVGGEADGAIVEIARLWRLDSVASIGIEKERGRSVGRKREL